MKTYKNSNVMLLMAFILGTIFCYHNLSDKIALYMQNPPRLLFMLVSFLIMLGLTLLSFYPHKISKSKDDVRNEVTITVLSLLNISIFLYYFTIVAQNQGLKINSLKIIILIIGGLMIFVGNLLPQMPFRSCIGFKLPWILKDKLCWQKTHRFAGFTAIPLGILQCLLVLFLDNNNLVFMFGLGLWIVSVCIYSLFIFFRVTK